MRHARRNRGIYDVLTEEKDCFKVMADARLKLEKIPLLLCRALRRKTAERNLRQVHLQLMPLESTGACANVKLQHVDHVDETGHVGRFHFGLVQKPVPIQEAVKIPESQAAVGQEWQILSRQSSVGCKESEIKVRSHPSDEEGWKNSSLHEFDGPFVT